MSELEIIIAARNTLCNISVAGRENLDRLLGTIQALDKLEEMVRVREAAEKVNSQ